MLRYAIPFLFAMSSPLAAQDFVADQYFAYIGGADLSNSSGAGLGDAASVLRQDRANVHRFGIAQSEDEYDVLYDTADTRAMMPALINAGGGLSSAEARAIMRGGVMVSVTTYSNGNNLTAIAVSVGN